MVNKTCRCRPAAYPISLTMAVVRNLTEQKGKGMFTEPPDTRLIAMASPMARPVPSTTAVIIPGFAAGRITVKTVCIRDAPRAREESLSCCGTASMAASLILITVGRIMTASTKTADSRFAPPVN